MSKTFLKIFSSTGGNTDENEAAFPAITSNLFDSPSIGNSTPVVFFALVLQMRLVFQRKP